MNRREPLEPDAVRWNHLTAESGSGLSSLERVRAAKPLTLSPNALWAPHDASMVADPGGDEPDQSRSGVGRPFLLLGQAGPTGRGQLVLLAPVFQAARVRRGRGLTGEPTVFVGFDLLVVHGVY
jgi:hypothetical protein